MTTRFDKALVRATVTEDGTIKDTPVLSRTGVFTYRAHDGSLRRELRHPDEVFKADSLATLRGIPITDEHHGKVGANNVKPHLIGSVLSDGRQDEANLVADLVIHVTDAVTGGKKELSLGYETDLIEQAGDYNGERYDAVQTNIRYNHLALVNRGRAGNARLNLDAAQAVDFETGETMTNMSKIRLDSGLEYDAAPEVLKAFDALKQDKATLQVAVDAATATGDAAKAELEAVNDSIEAIKQDAYNSGVARSGLMQVAKQHGITLKEDATDKGIKSAVIAKLRGDALDLSDKSDAYIDAAFDLSIAHAAKADAAGKGQAQEINKGMNQDAQTSRTSKDARDTMIQNLKGEK